MPQSSNFIDGEHVAPTLVALWHNVQLCKRIGLQTKEIAPPNLWREIEILAQRLHRTIMVLSSY